LRAKAEPVDQLMGAGLSQSGGHAPGRKLGLAVDIKDAA